MIRLITAGACALFLMGCSAEAPDNGGAAPDATGTDATAPPAKIDADAAATVTSAKFELGKNI